MATCERFELSEPWFPLSATATCYVITALEQLRNAASLTATVTKNVS